MTNGSALSFIKKPAFAFLSVLLTAGCLMGLAQQAFAQTTDSKPSDIFQDPNQNDPFSSRGNGQAGSMLDIVNRAILGPSRSSQEYGEAQRENLDDAAAQFRKQQQQRLQNQQPEGATTPAPVTPAN
jgi:hypothetical protein